MEPDAEGCAYAHPISTPQIRKNAHSVQKIFDLNLVIKPIILHRFHRPCVYEHASHVHNKTNGT